jgi:hypothetical protein
MLVRLFCADSQINDDQIGGDEKSCIIQLHKSAHPNQTLLLKMRSPALGLNRQADGRSI